MEQLEFVRADFYSCGTIVPLGMKRKRESSIIIEKVLESQTISDANGHKGKRFTCAANKCEIVLLYFKNKWYID